MKKSGNQTNPLEQLKSQQKKEAAFLRISQAEHAISNHTEGESLKKSIKTVLNSVSMAQNSCPASSVTFYTASHSSNPLPFFHAELEDCTKGSVFLLAPNTFEIQLMRSDLPAVLTILPEPFHSISLSSSIPEGVQVNKNQISLTTDIQSNFFYLVATVVPEQIAVSATFNFFLT